MNIIFQIDGGLGKCIMSTAICKIIKENNPDSELIVVSGYPDVYLNNPSVDKAFAFGEEKYFYERYFHFPICLILRFLQVLNALFSLLIRPEEDSAFDHDVLNNYHHYKMEYDAAKAT